ncbi:MAG: GNAT family N-acetyltransferase [bacterium]
MSSYVIESLGPAEAAANIDGLANVLSDCVEGGASVSFMLPFPREKAETFWETVTGSVSRGETILLAARDDAGICGTVQLQMGLPENQPHRGEIAKLLVHRRARRRGIAEALMARIESEAARVGRSLLVLDTASDTAERLYRRMGWTECGVIPDFALFPDGRPCATVFFWKRVATA